jgi:hypothetical protein
MQSGASASRPVSTEINDARLSGFPARKTVTWVRRITSGSDEVLTSTRRR